MLAGEKIGKFGDFPPFSNPNIVIGLICNRTRVFDKILSLDQIGSSQAMGEPLYF